MTEETVQHAPAGDDGRAATAPAGEDTSARGALDGGAPGAAEPPVRAPRRRRAPKQDALLVADVAAARAGVEQIADPSLIGSGHRVVAEEDRLVVHLFECTLPGYRGWNWFASLARAPRSRTVTVCEVGLLPGEEALLAPEWVPWAERVSPEEKAQEDAEDAAEGVAEDAADVEGAAARGPVDPVEPAAEDAEEDTAPARRDGERS